MSVKVYVELENLEVLVDAIIRGVSPQPSALSKHIPPLVVAMQRGRKKRARAEARAAEEANEQANNNEHSEDEAKYNLLFRGCAANRRIHAIKAVRVMAGGMGLKEAVQAVDQAPTVIRRGLTAGEAQALINSEEAMQHGITFSIVADSLIR